MRRSCDPRKNKVTLHQLLTHTAGFATGGAGYEEPTPFAGARRSARLGQPRRILATTEPRATGRGARHSLQLRRHPDRSGGTDRRSRQRAGLRCVRAAAHPRPAAHAPTPASVYRRTSVTASSTSRSWAVMASCAWTTVPVQYIPAPCSIPTQAAQADCTPPRRISCACAGCCSTAARSMTTPTATVLLGRKTVEQMMRQPPHLPRSTGDPVQRCRRLRPGRFGTARSCAQGAPGIGRRSSAGRAPRPPISPSTPRNG